MADQGDMVPDVTMTTPDDGAFRPAEAKGDVLIVYFYPKDDTSGCTREGQDFSALMPEFASIGARVIGVSKDSPASHRKFITKYDLKVELATDADDSVCEAFGVWVEKSMYGRKYMGIERATFLIDREGRIARVWRKVKVADHAAQVLEAAKALG